MCVCVPFDVIHCSRFFGCRERCLSSEPRQQREPFQFTIRDRCVAASHARCARTVRACSGFFMSRFGFHSGGSTGFCHCAALEKTSKDSCNPLTSVCCSCSRGEICEVRGCKSLWRLNSWACLIAAVKLIHVNESSCAEANDTPKMILSCPK